MSWPLTRAWLLAHSTALVCSLARMSEDFSSMKRNFHMLKQVDRVWTINTFLLVFVPLYRTCTCSFVRLILRSSSDSHTFLFQTLIFLNFGEKLHLYPWCRCFFPRSVKSIKIDYIKVSLPEFNTFPGTSSLAGWSPDASSSQRCTRRNGKMRIHEDEKMIVKNKHRWFSGLISLGLPIYM